MADSLFNN